MQSQSVELEDLQADQEVYGSDGQKLGHVDGLNVDRDTGERFLEVAAGPFDTLYVPKDAIEQGVIGRPVRLKVPADEARTRFIERPNIY